MIDPDGEVFVLPDNCSKCIQYSRGNNSGIGFSKEPGFPPTDPTKLRTAVDIALSDESPNNLVILAVGNRVDADGGTIAQARELTLQYPDVVFVAATGRGPRMFYGGPDPHPLTAPHDREARAPAGELYGKSISTVIAHFDDMPEVTICVLGCLCLLRGIDVRSRMRSVRYILFHQADTFNFTNLVQLFGRGCGMFTALIVFFFGRDCDFQAVKAAFQFQIDALDIIIAGGDPTIHAYSSAAAPAATTTRRMCINNALDCAPCRHPTAMRAEREEQLLAAVTGAIPDDAPGRETIISDFIDQLKARRDEPDAEAIVEMTSQVRVQTTPDTLAIICLQDAQYETRRFVRRSVATCLPRFAISSGSACAPSARPSIRCLVLPGLVRLASSFRARLALRAPRAPRARRRSPRTSPLSRSWKSSRISWAFRSRLSRASGSWRSTARNRARSACSTL